MTKSKIAVDIGKLNGKVESVSMGLNRMSYRLTRMSIRAREGRTSEIMYREMLRLTGVATDLEAALQQANGAIYLLEKIMEDREKAEQAGL